MLSMEKIHYFYGQLFNSYFDITRPGNIHLNPHMLLFKLYQCWFFVDPRPGNPCFFWDQTGLFFHSLVSEVTGRSNRPA